MASVVCSSRDAVRLIHRLVLVLITVGILAPVVSAQTTVTLNTTADLTIQGGASALVDFSSSPVLVSKVSSESYTRRILLQFDTQNFIPANAIIQSAQLHLVLKHAESGESRPLTAYHVTNSFVAGETNWLYFRGGQRWNSPGGDLGARFTTTYVGNAVGSAYKFDLTGMVQRAVNGEFDSRYTRVALVDIGGSSGGNYKEFHSSRAIDAGVRPRLVITYTTKTVVTSEPPPTNSTTLRVMQWNVQKTRGGDGVCNPDRVANTIVQQNVHVVGLNEVNFFSGACAWEFDMGVRLQSLLQQKTGETWYRQAVNVYGGRSGYGNVLLSRLPPTSSGLTLLSYSRGVAQMTVVVNGRNVNLFSTHVEYDVAWWRPTQLAEAIGWAGNFSEPRILLGDFNMWPGTSDYNIVASRYQDAWVVAQNAGTASAYNGSGATHGASRFDYVFYSRVGVLSLRSVTVVDARVNGVFPSDHDPVVAVFEVK
jgi:endonuclease/exonuclease/phosphatase family metal-dependent hydrolase